jgi:murein DD-endopeptidase MepM/ murein hydrolase activator NlpD
MKRPIDSNIKENYNESCKFGSLRDNGKRYHAGRDFKVDIGTPIKAIADGIVWNAYKEFYQGTGCVEIIHQGICIARYGEIEVLVKEGQKVKEGDIIGRVKAMTTGSHMLHFELYSDWNNTKDPLTDKSESGYKRGFARRKDLIDPLPILKQCK